MSFTRRLAAGLPAVGVTTLAALAFAGAPAQATGDAAERAGYPVVMTTPCPASQTPCDDGDAASDGYGTDDAGGGTADAADADAADDDRGNAGYGGESPTTSPAPTPTTAAPSATPTSPTPTGEANTVPPGGVSPATLPATPGGGVSAGTLPVTGTPMGATIGVGTLLVAAGAAAVWYTRRRRHT